MSGKSRRYDVYAMARASGAQRGKRFSFRVTVTRFWLAPS